MIAWTKNPAANCRAQAEFGFVSALQTAIMGFDLPGLLAERSGQGYELHARYLNPQLPRMLHAIGFDKVYERAEGAYLYDATANRYADFLSGFGVFGSGTTIRSSARRCTMCSTPNWPTWSSSTAPCCPACWPSGCWPTRRDWTGPTSATAAPRQLRRR